MPLEAGSRLGRYEIQALIGSGGMGEVYLAHDTKLQRKVALKLLLSRYSTSDDRLERFAREASVVSGLNHPNIVTVYDVDADGGTHFITTEFIAGETLRSQLSRGPIPLSEALRIAAQVADALAAAHREGIVHRDIKPENILLRPDGYVKVVDFGLAKLAEGAASEADTMATTRAALETSAGVILGTVAYMSPEQARGLPVDARTDVWSLGVVLYEMIVGRRPFTGPTSSDVIALILQRDPPKMAPFAAGVTGEVELVVETALAKDVEERYQSARDLVNVLKRVRRHLDTGAEIDRTLLPGEVASGSAAGDRGRLAEMPVGTSPAAQQTPTISNVDVPVRGIKGRTAATSAAVALLLVVAAAGYLVYQGRQRAPSPRPLELFDRFKISRLTSSNRVLDAAISPDGRYVVHSVDDGPGQSLWVRQVNANSNVQIVPTAEVSYLGMTFSSDGDYIYYVSHTLNQVVASLYQIPVLGGVPRKVIDDVDTSVTFSPDGSRIAFMRGYGDGSISVIVANADGTNERRLPPPALPLSFAILPLDRVGPAWSPDGKTIASAIDVTDGQGRYVEIGVVDVNNGNLTLVTSRRWYMVRRLAWLGDGGGLLAAVADTSSAYSAQQVWRIPYPAGEPRRMTNDLSNYAGVSMTAAGGAFLTVQTATTSTIWVAPRADPGAASVVTPSGATIDGTYGLTWTPDGQILYSSAPTGMFDLWIMNPDGSRRRLLATNGGASIYPDVSQDGKSVVFSSDRGSNVFQIWRIGIDASGITPLTRDYGFGPKTSGDGSVIYSSADRIWRVPLDGGTPVVLTSKSTSRPAVSPNGKLFVCSYRDASAAPSQLAVYRIEGGTPVQVLEIPATADRQAQWAPDGRALHYIDTRNGVSNIWSVSLNGGPATQLTKFGTDRIFSFAWSRDGTKLALSRGSVASDAVLFTTER